MKRIKLVTVFIIIIALLSPVTVFGGTPATADDYFNLGRSAWAAGKLDEAIKNFDMAIALDPKHTESYMLKASCLSLRKDYDEALKCIDKAIELDPENKSFYANKGSCLVDLGRYQEAVEAFKIGITKDDDLYYVDFAFAYLSLNDIENCLVSLRKYVINYSGFKEFIDDLFFEKLSTNPAFIEMMGDSRYKIDLSFSNGHVLTQNPFDNTIFLEAGKGLNDAEKQEILSADSRFTTNLFNGNVYNEATAKLYGFYSTTSVDKDFIQVGRFIKKLHLVGFNINYSAAGSKVLYVGRTNGVLNAAIVESTMSLSFQGVSDPLTQIYLVYVKNNGVWNLVTGLTERSQTNKQ